MKKIAKLGVMLVAAVPLWLSPAWAAPADDRSEQWLYTEWDVDWAWGGPWIEYVSCLGEEARITGVFRALVNIHTTPTGYQTYTRHFVEQDGDLVLTGLTSGRQYLI